MLFLTPYTTTIYSEIYTPVNGGNYPLIASALQQNCKNIRVGKLHKLHHSEVDIYPVNIVESLFLICIIGASVPRQFQGNGLQYSLT